jgi:hypothetical protein
MTDLDAMKDQMGINGFVGIFLTVTSIGVLVLQQNVVNSLVLLLVGIFFLTRAIAQQKRLGDDV